MRTRKIVLGVDGSDCGAQAMGWVADLAADLDIEVVAVHAFDLVQALGLSEGVYSSVDDSTLLKAAKDELESVWVAPLRDAGLRYRAIVVEGNPAGAILETAEKENADMIVVGARGRGGFAEMLLGSVSHHISHHARRPVVIIHATR